MLKDTGKMGARGTLVVPQRIRQALGLRTGDLLLFEVRPDHSVVIREAVAMPVEKYTPAREAEFLLNNAMDTEEYDEAVTKVRAMGLNPSDIPHDPPPSNEVVS